MGKQNYLQGVVRCNHCKAVILLQHRRAHALDCSARKRKLKLDKITFTRNGHSLYAIACARRIGKELWRQENNYEKFQDASKDIDLKNIGVRPNDDISVKHQLNLIKVIINLIKGIINLIKGTINLIKGIII